MSHTPFTPSPILIGSEGELLFLRVEVEPRLLECLLEAIASLSFPINPDIYHQHMPAAVAVEFPAYEGRIPEVRRALRSGGLGHATLQVRSALARVS
ncbi:MAG: hypothetical protein IT164_12865 [Bryobacterales bacterium]|nr:hypothetical protein [Bryobacterales bacterium]